MPTVLNAKGVPHCCGYALIPGWPVCQCGFCGNTYDSYGIAQLISFEQRVAVEVVEQVMRGALAYNAPNGGCRSIRH